MTNDTTPAPIGADALAGLHALADRIEETRGRSMSIDPRCADVLRTALASAAQPAPIGVDTLREAAYGLIEACERDWPSTPRHRAAVLKHAAALRAALASAAQPTDVVAYGLEAWVDGAWHLQWPLRPTEADAEQDRTMYAADAKLRLVRLSAAAPKAAPAPALATQSTPADYRADVHSSECYDEACPGCAAPAVQHGEPIGYLAAYEIDRLKQGHDGRLRSPKFGPSPLDSDVPVYLGPLPTAGVLALVQKWRHAAEHLGLRGLASLADCADELEAALRASHGQAPAPAATPRPSDEENDAHVDVFRQRNTEVAQEPDTQAAQRIHLQDGGELRKVEDCPGVPKIWAFYREGVQVRYLNEFENDFVDSALAAARTTQASHAAQGGALDAARYRWLRRARVRAGHGDIVVYADDRSTCAGFRHAKELFGDALDAAVDAARAAKEGGADVKTIPPAP